MSKALTEMTSVEKAIHAQRMAADPSGTRLAAANAGSGKTRVLVDRVSRILLGGTKPEDILCLTYTKAAASEMQERLFAKLGSWSVLEDAALHKALTELFGQPPENLNPPIKFPEARELFAKALETPEGLKVQTIHAFCERILSRFPIEAGILPGFEPLDDVEMADLRAEVEAKILSEAMISPSGDLAKSLDVLTLERADSSLEDLFKWMSSEPQKITAWETLGLEPLVEGLNLSESRDPVEIAKGFWRLVPKETLIAAISDLQTSQGKRDLGRADMLKTNMDIKDDLLRFQACHKVWLTAKNEITSQLVAKGTPEIGRAFLENHSELYLSTHQKIRACHIYALTESVFNLSVRYTELYRDAKHKARGLDYSDQILLVRRLLQNSEAADWVRYKLDGGVEHILLDEAQDTSPEQWEIINILAAPFFQPHPDDDPKRPRTLFAVGDEKQSIYGFQGAKPERFLGEIRRHSEHATTDIRMAMSFRSTQAVLDVVDSVLFDCGGMQAMFNPEEYPPASDETRHIAHRTDMGMVELWPITPPPQKPEENEAWDTTPVDAKGEGHQIEILAKDIAQTVKGWIDNGDPVFNRTFAGTRPIEPQDVLILVRRRGPLFEAIIRQLKRHEIPIAGADRLKLSEAIIVKDLIALSRFCLLPSDDLSLAETLKSPLFGYDDDALMAVAIDRERSLVSALESRRPDTYEILEKFIKFSRELTPYDFFARVLDHKDSSGLSMRKRFYKRLSLEAKDALEAFLHQALDHQSRLAPNLQTFLKTFSQGDVEIKREQDSSLFETRVMTVHGAKGLEAPIVILPDTTNTPALRDVLLPEEAGGQIWNKGTLPYVDAAKEAAKARQSQEQLRLLYVAMTRAESRLIVCGPHVGKMSAKLKEGCWYDWVKRGLEALNPEPFEMTLNDKEVTILRYGGEPEPISKLAEPYVIPDLDLPNWINQPAAKERRRSRVTPSHLLSNPPIEMAVRSPGEAKDQSVFQRGNLIHKLLELLPDVAPSNRRATAQKMLSSNKNMPTELATQIIDEVFAVLEHPKFAHIFAPETRAEVSLAGSAKTLPDGLYLNAQIDRLCVTATEVIIVDYKSNRPPPTDPADVSDLYLGQMAAYRELAREIYPSKSVSCALLWTDGPHLMLLPDSLLDVALQKIAALPIS